MRPLLVVFEGLDGCGKSTLAREVAGRLRAALLSTPGERVKPVREVIDAAYALEPLARQLFYASTVAAASGDARAHLAAGRSVVVDRYLYSTLAYDVVRPGGIDLAPLERALRAPDVTVFVDAPEPVRLARLAVRGATALDREAVPHAAAIGAKYRELLGRPFAGEVCVVASEGACTQVLADEVCRFVERLG